MHSGILCSLLSTVRAIATGLANSPGTGTAKMSALTEILSVSFAANHNIELIESQIFLR